MKKELFLIKLRGPHESHVQKEESCCWFILGSEHWRSEGPLWLWDLSLLEAKSQSWRVTAARLGTRDRVTHGQAGSMGPSFAPTSKAMQGGPPGGGAAYTAGL